MFTKMTKGGDKMFYNKEAICEDWFESMGLVDLLFIIYYNKIIRGEL